MDHWTFEHGQEVTHSILAKYVHTLLEYWTGQKGSEYGNITATGEISAGNKSKKDKKQIYKLFVEINNFYRLNM